MAYGARVFTQIDRSVAHLAQEFVKYPTGNVADCMNRLGSMNYEIRQFCRKDLKMCGVAVTVNAGGGDNLMLHKAMNLAQKGDVIVIGNFLSRNRSLLGDVMMKFINQKGVAGLVADGPIRDIEEIYELNIPIYATGSTPGGPYKNGPGEVNVPISCGGVVVEPGDLILGDADGIVVIPKRDAAEILEKTIAFAAADSAKAAAAAAGLAKRDWVDKALADMGCEIIEGVYR